MYLCPLAMALVGAAAAEPPRLDDILSRIAEEAEVFARSAPQAFAEEKLEQRARLGTPRFRPRMGDSALKPPPVRFQTREIISEYGFAALKESPNVLHELRQVVSVDGRPVLSRERARRSLSLGIRSEDDQVKKRMLLEFEKHGLIGTVVDFGQMLLLFSKRRLSQYQFTVEGTTRIGADEVAVVGYRQVGGTQSLTVFEGREALHQLLNGRIYVRLPDLAPVRMTTSAARQKGNDTIRDEAEVDYAMSPHAVMLPVAVVHRQFWGKELMAENIFHYSAFRRFSAESEIKFTEVPPEPPKSKLAK